MATPSRSFPRATEPHLKAVEDAIRSHMSGNGHPAFYLSYLNGNVILKAPSLSSVEDSVIQAAVDAAPVATNALAAKAMVDSLSPIDLAIERVHLDELNEVRANLNPAKTAISEATHLGAIKAKLDELIPDQPAKPPKEKDKP
jgi:hypothetical protein